MEVLTFWLLSGIIIGSALGVVLLNNIVHSAMLLIVTFLGVAGIYITLHAEFLGLVQILIYAGAVSILIIFGIMLTRKGDMTNSNPLNKYKYIGFVAIGALFFIISKVVLATSWNISPLEPKDSYVGPIIEMTLVDLLLPFQLSGILLLIAMVGAIVLSKGVKKTS